MHKKISPKMVNLIHVVIAGNAEEEEEEMYELSSLLLCDLELKQRHHNSMVAIDVTIESHR